MALIRRSIRKLLLTTFVSTIANVRRLTPANVVSHVSGYLTVAVRIPETAAATFLTDFANSIRDFLTANGHTIGIMSEGVKGGVAYVNFTTPQLRPYAFENWTLLGEDGRSTQPISEAADTAQDAAAGVTAEVAALPVVDTEALEMSEA